MKELAGRVAFVTGGASGIGKALAAELVQAGMDVMVADVEQVALDRAVAEVERASGGRGRVSGVACDVADADSVEAAAAATLDAFGKVHLLCNNAGVIAGGPFESIGEADWQWVLSVNVMGVVHGIRTFLPLIRKHGEGGHVVNTSSGAGLFNPGMLGPYAASKYAVVGISEGLAAELAGSSIHVSVVCPSYVNTRMPEAARNRPRRYGGPPDFPADDERNPLHSTVPLLKTGMEPSIAARRIVECIRADRFYIFTHPEFRVVVEHRHALMLADLDDAESSALLTEWREHHEG